MNNGLKIAAFATALTATFGAAYGVGNAVDPVNAEPAAHQQHQEETGEKAEGQGQEKGKGHQGHQEKQKGGSGARGAETPGGLQTSDGGYRLDLETRTAEAEKNAPLRFRVLDRRGREVTAYREEHGKELHLILASRDLGTFRHLHPDRAEDGTWSTRVKLPRAGDYRLFADFTPDAKGADNLTLGADLAVSGRYRPQPLPEPAKTSKIDGYTVTLDGGLRPGAARELTLKVSKDGRPVTDLEPYLGANGHLVALRDGDLAYLHVHPEGKPGDSGPEVAFTATAPSAGSYRLFLDFKHEGKVRTADFTVTTDGAPEQEQGKQEQEQGKGSEEPGHKH